MSLRLWEDGWKDRYYKSKFDCDPSDQEFRYNVARHYVRGLCWVLRCVLYYNENSERDMRDLQCGKKINFKKVVFF